MKIKLLILAMISAAVLYPAVSYANDEKETKYPIDTELEECFNKEGGYTTLGMVQCYGDADDKWDAELNKNYKLLMNILPKKEKAELKKAQRLWLQYRDAENTLKASAFNIIQGSMWRIVYAGEYMENTKKRALELERYYKLLKEAAEENTQEQ
ncbi:YecT [Parelusimicrobium proximum]|uniref:lysozyme inhibitor LprI family protein n=1 Tax=Parelusimicrobium proximum TaxID=3228953 RepID=UPI003D17B558